MADGHPRDGHPRDGGWPRAAKCYHLSLAYGRTLPPILCFVSADSAVPCTPDSAVPVPVLYYGSTTTVVPVPVPVVLNCRKQKNPHKITVTCQNNVIHAYK
jgi:hypothetical protein